MKKDWRRVLADTEDWTGTYWATATSKWVNNLLSGHEFLFVTLGPGMVGTEAWIFAKNCPNVKILGFEPQKERYDFMKGKFPGELKNAAVTANVGKIQGWTGHKEGKSDFWLSASGENCSNYVATNVETTTIDNILKDENIPTALWLDIEGSELEALRGGIISLMKKKVFLINVELDFVKKDESHCNWEDVVELLRLFGYVAIGASGLHDMSTIDSVSYVSKIYDDPHSDVAFVSLNPEAAKSIPPGYLNYVKREIVQGSSGSTPYVVAAMKRTGQHGVVNWLAQQMPHDVMHFNACGNGWEDKQLLPMKDAMAVFYSWNQSDTTHNIDNYFHDWKLDAARSKELINEFHSSNNNSKFSNVKSCIYNLEDFDLDVYENKNFSSFKQLDGCKKILLVRSAKNFVASSLQRKVNPPDAGATDVAYHLAERMKLWKQHAREALDPNSDWYVIKFDNWFSDKEYRRKICDDLGLQFTDNGLNSVMNFGSGSSFDRQSFDNNAQSMKVLERWKQYHDQEELMSYIDDEVKELNRQIFGE